MDERTVSHALENAIKADNSLRHSGHPCVVWTPGMEEAFLDGEFTADQLEAIAWWMRNKSSRGVNGG